MSLGRNGLVALGDVLEFGVHGEESFDEAAVE